MGCRSELGPVLTKEHNVDKVMYFTTHISRIGDYASYRNSIAFISLNTTFTGKPCASFTHEFMHLLNFADEYIYVRDPHLV